MNRSTRYVLVSLLVLAACVISLIFCIDFGKSSGKEGKYAPIFSGKQFTENELIQIELAFADAKLSDYVISDGSVQVPKRQKTVFLQALKKLDFLTAEFSENSGSSGGLFVSEKEREASALREKQAALAAQIRTFHGIESARILLDVSETKTGFTREKHASAAVSIRSRAGYAVTQDDIQSILRLVTCSVCNLNAANVTIVDTRTNQSWRFDAPKIETMPEAPAENAPQPTESVNSNQSRKIILRSEPLPQPELWNSSSREILQVSTDESIFAAPSASSAPLGQISLTSHSEAPKTAKAPETLPELASSGNESIPVFSSNLGEIKLPEVQTSANHSHQIPMILGILAAPVILICIWIIYATRKGLFRSERKRLAAQNQKTQESEAEPAEMAHSVSQADLMAALVSEIADEAEEDPDLMEEMVSQAEPEVEPEPDAEPEPEPEPEPQRVILAELAALEQVAPERLALAFLEERPQTAAMLLSQMKPETSAAVLEHIPTKLREGIESRMTGSQAPDEEILRKAAQVILEHLDELDGVPAEEDDFLETVGAILKSNETKKPQVPEKPVIRPLAEAIPKERVLRRFEDLKSCSDSELRGILSETPVQDVNLALLGAEPELVDRVLNVLPKSAAEELQFQLTHPGKVRLMEVEEARQRMLEHAGV
ncbi:MAG: hypothetical protein K6C40_09420 [Thermoguttaceae bacterium]|nr:hypothetical protein [Thermoguttaceae bacterium]